MLPGCFCCLQAMNFSCLNIFDTLENPSVIFEVLSKSTKHRDRADKAIDYLKMESLTDYLLVSQDEMGLSIQTRFSEG